MFESLQESTRRLAQSMTATRYNEAPSPGDVGVGSDRGAVPRFPPVRLLGPPSEPDVRVSAHPALHESMPLQAAMRVSSIQGVGMRLPR